MSRKVSAQKAPGKTVRELRSHKNTSPNGTTKTFKHVLEKFEKGLPAVSSGEVLSRRVKW